MWSFDQTQALFLVNLAYASGRYVYKVGRMTNEDRAFEAAIIDQLNAELGAAGMSMKDFAQKMGRPYDSTRNYLKRERAMPLSVFLQAADVLGVTPDQIIRRAEERLR